MKVDESKLVQQHLANERTFLAWVRTSIAIMGVGFVTTSLHFELRTFSNLKADALIRAIGYASLALGCVTFLSSTWAYLAKRKGINTGSFKSSSWIVMFVALSLMIVAVIFAMYLYNAY